MGNGLTIFWVAAVVAVGFGVAAVVRRPRSPTSWLFWLGMVGMAVVTVCGGLALGAPVPAERRWWLTSGLVVAAGTPAVWLAFSLVYSRGNWREFLRSWCWLLGVMLGVPLGIAVGFRDELVGIAWAEGVDGVAVPLLVFGGPARWLHIVLLAAAVLVLVNLERTFRAAVGTMRWRVKFLVLGLAVLFGARIYTLSQSLLFSVHDPAMTVLDAVSLLVACVLIGVAYVRRGFAELDVYPSREVLQNSITIVVAGAYLLVVGVLAQVVALLGGLGSFQAQAFIVLLGVVGLVVLLLSERFRLGMRRFVSRHFRRPQHDFRRIWRLFTHRVATVFDRGRLAHELAKLLAENFNVLSVRVLVFDRERDRIVVAASTFAGEGGGDPAPAPAAPPAGAASDPATARALAPGPVIEGMAGRSGPFVLDAIDAPWAESLRALCPTEFRHGGDRLGVPMVAGDQVIGVVVLADRVNGASYTEEELELLTCIGDQAAAALLNLRLAEALGEARELEAFQAMSTFFVHDLKNAASSLGLMLTNLPVHFDDPEFREDAVRAIGKSVDRINQMIVRLSSLRQQLEPRTTPASLNRVVTGALEAIELPEGIDLAVDLADSLPPVALDVEQIASVVTNLVINAREALADNGGGNGSGTIRVATTLVESESGGAGGGDDGGRGGGGGGRSVRLVVSDDGCGMPPEFVRDSLFRPFQTTKSKGLGIGTFQSKTIVERHGGRIRVDSRPGEGTRFEITLPAGE